MDIILLFLRTYKIKKTILFPTCAIATAAVAPLTLTPVLFMSVFFVVFVSVCVFVWVSVCEKKKVCKHDHIVFFVDGNLHIKKIIALVIFI